MEWDRIKISIEYGCVPTFTCSVERAEWNRYIIDNHLFIIGYLQIEQRIKSLKKGEMMPASIPLGYVPGA